MSHSYASREMYVCILKIQYLAIQLNGFKKAAQSVASSVQVRHSLILQVHLSSVCVLSNANVLVAFRQSTAVREFARVGADNRYQLCRQHALPKRIIYFATGVRSGKQLVIATLEGNSQWVHPAGVGAQIGPPFWLGACVAGLGEMVWLLHHLLQMYSPRHRLNSSRDR